MFSVATISDRFRRQRRGITALNISGLGGVEATAAGAIAAVSVGLLGAFLVLERPRIRGAGRRWR